jgi:hypothetical protein
MRKNLIFQNGKDSKLSVLKLEAHNMMQTTWIVTKND